MKCVRCHVNIPDKALFCPWCGKQQDATSAPVHRKKRRRPKGSGSVYKLKGVRARPYVAVTGKKEVLGTYGTPGEAVQALDAYNAQNTPAERLKCTFADAYEKWRAQPKFSSLSRDMINGYEQEIKKAFPGNRCFYFSADSRQKLFSIKNNYKQCCSNHNNLRQ